MSVSSIKVQETLHGFSGRELMRKAIIEEGKFKLILPRGTGKLEADIRQERNGNVILSSNGIDKILLKG